MIAKQHYLPTSYARKGKAILGMNLHLDRGPTRGPHGLD